MKPEESLEQSNGPVWLQIYTDEGFHYKKLMYTIKIKDIYSAIKLNHMRRSWSYESSLILQNTKSCTSP